MKTRLTSVFCGVFLLLLLSCGSSDLGGRSLTAIDREAIDVPDRFEAPAGTTMGENSCLNPLTDPRNGTKIILRTAFGDEGVGDYEVPSGMYGVGSRELLRINCSTGEVMGIVPR